MKYAVLMLLTLFLAAAPLHADYIVDRKAAVALMQTRQYAEALDAFRTMADGDVTDFQKADALTQAAICAAIMKKPELAMELTEAIPLAPESKAAQMEVLFIGRGWREIVDRFGEEDLHAWPDYVANGAYVTRGKAAVFAKDYELAIKDFYEALRFPMDGTERGKTLNLLGVSYINLGQQDQALEVYQESLRVADVYRSAGAAMAISRIHTERGEHDKAAKVLDMIDMDQMQSIVWRCMAIIARGDVLAGKGDTDGAIAQYEMALAVEGIPDHLQSTCKKNIEALRPEADQ